MSERRRRAWRRGRRGETLCVWHLRLCGWRILARNIRSAVGEIDIVARRGRIVAFVEVKARRDAVDAAHAIGDRQRQRIARAAASFMAGRPGLAGLDMRFDAMLVAPGRLPRRIVDAWRP